MRHDDPDTFEVQGPPDLALPADAVIRVLTPLVTEQRLQRIEEVAAGRTTAVVPVLEAFSDPHNVSAILRTSEALGLQRVDVVPGPYGFRASQAVAKGSHRWLDIHPHETSEAAADALAAAGYELFIAVMEGDETPTTLGEMVAGGRRIAIAFGNERRGVSDVMRARAAGSFRVPMRGFVESLNVSVAAAVTLYTAAERAPRALRSGTQRELIARYLMHSVKDAETVLREQLG